MHSTPKPPVVQPPQEYLVTNIPSLAFQYLGTCPRSQSLVAYSLTYEATVLFALPCRTWSCRPCAETKIKALAATVLLAAPNRLLTLTVNPALYSSRREAWENTRKCVPLLIRRLRKDFGEIEYLRVTEVTKNGYPHYHLLVRSGFLPHSVVKRYWSELTGATIVDIRQVTKSWSAYKYLVKYLAKLHQLEWTERHVSMSRNFALKSKWKPDVNLETAEPEFIREHPAYVILERYQGLRLQRISPNTHIVHRDDRVIPNPSRSSQKPPHPTMILNPPAAPDAPTSF